MKPIGTCSTPVSTLAEALVNSLSQMSRCTRSSQTVSRPHAVNACAMGARRCESPSRPPMQVFPLPPWRISPKPSTALLCCVVPMTTCARSAYFSSVSSCPLPFCSVMSTVSGPMRLRLAESAASDTIDLVNRITRSAGSMPRVSAAACGRHSVTLPSGS